ncbi:MAG: hypothetical protein ACC628_16555 [Pirellulaceae bacterium]
MPISKATISSGNNSGERGLECTLLRSAKVILFFILMPVASGVHLGYGNFRDHHAVLEQALQAHRLSHVYQDGPRRKHIWESGWLPEAIGLLNRSEPSE